MSAPICYVHGVLCPFKCAESKTRFRILRYFSDGRPSKRIKTVATLELARLHCNSPQTKGELRGGVKWFDGFQEIRK